MCQYVKSLPSLQRLNITDESSPQSWGDDIINLIKTLISYWRSTPPDLINLEEEVKASSSSTSWSKTLEFNHYNLMIIDGFSVLIR